MTKRQTKSLAVFGGRTEVPERFTKLADKVGEMLDSLLLDNGRGYGAWWQVTGPDGGQWVAYNRTYLLSEHDLVATVSVNIAGPAED